jgi:hypothetical protein
MLIGTRYWRTGGRYEPDANPVLGDPKTRRREKIHVQAKQSVEAAAITGHASLKELQRYIETRDRKKAARRAMGKLISRTEVANTNISLANQEKKAICPS